MQILAELIKLLGLVLQFEEGEEGEEEVRCILHLL